MPSITDLRNVALIGHAKSGKTSLFEALLFNAGVTNRLGKVDEGNSFSDFDPEEIKKKFSIHSALAYLKQDGKKINILDTPGYNDFIGDVGASLQVCEGAVLVLSGTSGVGVGTEITYDLCKKYNVASIAFVNKLDKENSDFFKVFNQVREELNKGAVILQLPIGKEASFSGVVDLLQMKAFKFEDGKPQEIPIPEDLKERAAELREELIEAACGDKDELIEKYLGGGGLSKEEILSGLREGIAKGSLLPVLCGSGLLNIAVTPLLDIISLLPDPTAQGEVRGKNLKKDEEEIIKVDPASAFIARVFKIMADPHVGELTFFKVVSGTLKPGNDIYNATTRHKEKVSHIFSVCGKEKHEAGEIIAGDMGVLVKFKGVHIGNTLCEPGHPVELGGLQFPEPVIVMAVSPKSKKDQEKMGAAFSRLAEEDGTFKIHLDPELKQTLIKGMGELHLELMVEQLADKYGVEVELSRPEIAYRETIKKKAKGEGKHKKQSGGRGQYGHCFVEVEPLPEGDFEFVNKIFGGSIPSKYVPAVEKGVKETMAKGVLAKYPIIRVRTTIYDGTFHAVDSSDLAFQIAGSLAFKKAFGEALPILLEPVMDVEVRVSEDHTGDVISDLNSRRGKIGGMESLGNRQLVRAQVPEAEMYKYATFLRSTTQGRGVYTMKFSHYEEVPGQTAEGIIAKSKAEG